MKRISLILLLVTAFIFMTACMPRYGIIDDVEIDLGNSERFSEAEVQVAVDDFLNFFRTETRGSILNKVRYSAPPSDWRRGCPESDILLFVEFTVHRNDHFGPAPPGHVCSGIEFRLSRNDVSDEWNVERLWPGG